MILRKLAEGAAESELLEDYPHLTAPDIRAAMAYGAASRLPSRPDTNQLLGY